MAIKVQSRQVRPGVASAARQNVRSDPSAFGAIQGRALQQTGQQVQQLGRDEQGREARAAKVKKAYQDRVDLDAVNAETIKFQDFLRTRKAADSQLAGGNTKGMSERANQDIKKFSEKQISEMENSDQKRDLSIAQNPNRESYLNWSTGYEAGEFKKLEITNLDALMQNATRDAADSQSVDSDDEITLLRTRLALDDAVNQKIEKQGFTDEVAENVRAEAVSSYHEAILNQRVMYRGAGPAQDYYDAHKDEILPENREAVQKTITTEKVLQDAQAVTQKIKLTVSDRNEWMSTLEKFHFPKTEEGAKSRKVAESRLRSMISDEEKKDARMQEDLYLTAIDDIDNTATQEAAEDIADRVQDPIDRERARKFAKDKFNTAEMTDFESREAFIDAQEKIESGEIDSPRQLLTYKNLSKEHFNQLNNDLTRKQNTDVKLGHIKKATATTAYEGVKGEKRDVTNEAQNREYFWVQDELNAEAKIKGDNLTPDEAAKSAARLIVEYPERTVLGIGVGSEGKSRYEAEQDGTIDTWLPPINDTDIDEGKERREIKASFRRLGYKTDNETLFKLYKKEDILGMKLSQEEVREYQHLLRTIGRIKPIRK